MKGRENIQQRSTKEIDDKIKSSGNKPMQLLWDRFLKSKTELEQLQNGDIEKLRTDHMDLLLRRPLFLIMVGITVFWAIFTNFKLSLASYISGTGWNYLPIAVIACNGVYLAVFGLTAVQRSLIHPWKKLPPLTWPLCSKQITGRSGSIIFLHPGPPPNDYRPWG